MFKKIIAIFEENTKLKLENEELKRKLEILENESEKLNKAKREYENWWSFNGTKQEDNLND